MIIICVCLPGGFGRWCEQLMVRLAQSAGHPAELFTWPSFPQTLGFEPLPSVLDQIGVKLIGSSAAHLIAGIRQPDERLYAALASSEARFVVAMGDPRAAVCEIVAETGADAALVTRAVANCCPLMMRFAALSGALTLVADSAMADVKTTVARISDCFEVGLSRAAVDRLAKEFATAAATYGSGREPPVSAPLSEPERRVVEGALESYAKEFDSPGTFGPIVWKRELFIQYAQGFKRPTGLIDVPGQPGTLIYGPYMQLPPGQWAARVVLGISPEAARNSFLIDVYLADDRQLGHSVLAPGAGGVFSVDIDFTLGHLGARGIEIRVIVTNQNARGQVAFGHVVLQPLAMRGPDATSGLTEFASVLDL